MTAGVEAAVIPLPQFLTLGERAHLTGFRCSGWRRLFAAPLGLLAVRRRRVWGTGKTWATAEPPSIKCRRLPSVMCSRELLEWDSESCIRWAPAHVLGLGSACAVHVLERRAA